MSKEQEKSKEEIKKPSQPSALTETYKKTESVIEGKETLTESPKREDVRENEAQDVLPETFTEESEDKIAPLEKSGSEEISDSLVDPRFSVDHTEEIPEETKDVGKKVRGLTKSAETDSTADSE